MNCKMTTNSQLSTTEPKKQKQKQTEQTTRTGTESQKWRLDGGLSVGRGWSENGGKGTGNKKQNWQKIDMGRLRIVQEMEKLKNLHA